MWILPRPISLSCQNLKSSLLVLRGVEVLEAAIEINQVENITEIVTDHSHANQAVAVLQNHLPRLVITDHTTRKNLEILTTDQIEEKNPNKTDGHNLAVVTGVEGKVTIAVAITRIINLHRLSKLWQRLKHIRFSVRFLAS